MKTNTANKSDTLSLVARAREIFEILVKQHAFEDELRNGSPEGNVAFDSSGWLWKHFGDFFLNSNVEIAKDYFNPFMGAISYYLFGQNVVFIDFVEGFNEEHREFGNLIFAYVDANLDSLTRIIQSHWPKEYSAIQAMNTNAQGLAGQTVVHASSQIQAVVALHH